MTDEGSLELFQPSGKMVIILQYKSRTADVLLVRFSSLAMYGHRFSAVP